MSARIELLILLLGLVGVQLGCTTTVEWYRTVANDGRYGNIDSALVAHPRAGLKE